MDYKGDKSFRLLYIRETLERGEVLRKTEIATEFGITLKTFQRDIDSLRLYLAETNGGDIVFDRKNACYRLERKGKDWLTAQEVFTLCKILLESRALNKSEFNSLIDKLLRQVPPQSKRHVESLIANERVGYIPLKHGKQLIDLLWKISHLVAAQKVIKITYTRQDAKCRDHSLKPVGIMFSEYYFYLIAYLADDSKDFPTVFRIDRIRKIEENGDTFQVPYANRFSETEFRKRIQFMYPGELKTIRFIYSGKSIEAILDKLPTACAEKRSDGSYSVRAEVFGNGVDMWLRAQGDWITMLE